ncbi:MAG: hypothetical protein KKC05_01350 [Nanoarchaeota archaeon]|nr:hypothetical protein [Nanoarchaeota archaeon]
MAHMKIWGRICLLILLPVLAMGEADSTASQQERAYKMADKCYVITGFDQSSGDFRMKSASCKFRIEKPGSPIALMGWVDAAKSPIAREIYLSLEIDSAFNVWFGQVTNPYIYYAPPPERSWLAYTEFDNLYSVFERGAIIHGKIQLPFREIDLCYMAATFNGNGTEDDNNKYKDAFGRISVRNKYMNLYGCWNGGMQPDGHREIWNLGGDLVIDPSVQMYAAYLDYDKCVDGWFAGVRLKDGIFSLYEGDNFVSRHFEVVYQYMEFHEGTKHTFGLNFAVDNIICRLDVTKHGDDTKIISDVVYTHSFSK